MVDRKALVLINGLLGSLPEGDSLKFDIGNINKINSDGYFSLNISEAPQTQRDLLYISYNEARCATLNKIDTLGEVPIGGESPLVPFQLSFVANSTYRLRIAAGVGANAIFSAGYGAVADTDRGGDLVLDLGTPGASTSSGAILGNRRTGLLRVTAGAAGDMIRLHRGHFTDSGGCVLDFTGSAYAPAGEAGITNWYVRFPGSSTIALGSLTEIGIASFYLNNGTSRARLVHESSSFAFRPSTATVIIPEDNGAGAGYSITLSGGKASAGNAGGSITIGGDNGGTPGTDLSGNIIFDVGSQVASGATAYAGIRINGTDAIRMYRSSVYGSPVISGGADGTGGLAINATNLQLIGTGYLILGASIGLSIRKPVEYNDDGNRNSVLWDRGYLATSTSGAQNVWTFNMVNNVGYDFVVHFSCTNKTDKVTSAGYMRFVAQNNAGTGSDNGAAVDIVAASIPAGESGLTFNVVRSGIQIQAQVNPPDTDSRECRVSVHYFPSALT